MYDVSGLKKTPNADGLKMHGQQHYCFDRNRYKYSEINKLSEVMNTVGMDAYKAMKRPVQGFVIEVMFEPKAFFHSSASSIESGRCQ